MRSRSLMILSSRSSGTRPPFSMIGPTCLPTGVPAAMASRSMSPVEIRGTLRWSASRAACVPFPAPGGPRKITRGPVLAATTNPPALPGAAEAVVVAHDELRLHLGDGVHGHAHDDEQGGAAEVEVQAQAFRHPAQVVLGQELVQPGPDAGNGGDLEAGDEELRQQGDDREVDGAAEGDAPEDVVEVL